MCAAPAIGFAAHLAPFAISKPLSLAVSGGADSFAMLALAYEWAQSGGGLFDVQTVDHGLRAGSALESAAVADWCNARGIDCTIHRWDGKAASGNVMAAARLARYRLLAGHAALRGADLVLAHQADDVAETLLMRLDRKAGLHGIAPMRDELWMETQAGNRVRVLRPLLNMSRADLRAYAVAAGLPFVDDPGNADPSYARITARQILCGDPVLRLQMLATNKALGQLHRAMQAQLQDAWPRLVHCLPNGLVQISPRVLASLPVPLRFTALAHIMAGINRGSHLPRGPRLARMAEDLSGTLGGLLFVHSHDDAALIGREARACAAPMNVTSQAQVWDKRVRVWSASARYTIAALGGEGAAQLKAQRTGKVADLSSVPPALRAGLPALWCGDQLVCCPAFDALPDDVHWHTTLVLDACSPPIALFD